MTRHDLEILRGIWLARTDSLGSYGRYRGILRRYLRDVKTAAAVSAKSVTAMAGTARWLPFKVVNSYGCSD